MGHTDPSAGRKQAGPNARLKAQRARMGLTQQEVAEALAALAWEHDHEQLGVDADMVSKWERGAKRPRRLYRRLFCMLYNSTEEDLGLRQTQGGAPADDFSGEDVNRREFLRAAVVAPEVLRRVLRGAGGEAMEFTRAAATSGVGTGTLDHLEAVLTELRRSYYEQPPAEQFAVARAYRTRARGLADQFGFRRQCLALWTGQRGIREQWGRPERLSGVPPLPCRQAILVGSCV